MVIEDDVEAELHARFSEHRVRANGEWFHAAAEIMDFVGAK